MQAAAVLYICADIIVGVGGKGACALFDCGELVWGYECTSMACIQGGTDLREERECCTTCEEMGGSCKPPVNRHSMHAEQVAQHMNCSHC